MAISEIVFLSEVAFLSGVLSASLPYSKFSLFLAALIMAAFSFRRFSKIMAVLAAICVIVGAAYFNIHAELVRSQIPSGSEFSGFGYVNEEPRQVGSYLNVALKTDSGLITLKTSPLLQIAYGNRVEFSGIVQKGTDGKAYISFPKITSVEPQYQQSMKSWLYQIKSFFIEPFRRYLSYDAAGLAAGITLGVRSDFSPELKQAMKASGTTHIVALSGYNISILIVAIGALLKMTSRRLRLVFAVLIIILFVIMTGAEKSVVRAAIMGFIVLLAEQKGRVYSPKFALTFAAFIMVLIDPNILAFDLGFELSFLSLLGIIAINPLIRSRFDNEPGLLNWKENLSTTFSAQIAVAPLLLFKFGAVSLAGLLTNIVILELIPLSMLFSALFALVSGIAPLLGLMLGRLLEILLRVDLGIIRLGSSLPFAMTNSLFAVSFVYLSILGAIFIYQRHAVRTK